MYLIFKLHKKGFPVNQIYEDEVKPVSTRRFNNELMEMGNNEELSTVIQQNQATPDIKGDSYISFDSQGSYSTLGVVKVNIKPKPDIIPALLFDGLPEYVSSDEEEVIQQ